MTPPDVPRVPCDTGELIARATTDAGALWRLAEPGRQLDANVVRLPHTSSRSLAAGEDALCYLTVHRRRPGMQIRRHVDGGPDS